MFQLTPEIPLMASLWIRSGYDMKVEVSTETYQVGAHFKALNKAVLVAALKTLEKFFFISTVTEAQCKSKEKFQKLGKNWLQIQKKSIV